MAYSIKRQPDTVSAVSDTDKMRVYDASTGAEGQCSLSILSDYFSGAVGGDVSVTGTLDVAGATTLDDLDVNGNITGNLIGSANSVFYMGGMWSSGVRTATAFAGGGQSSATAIADMVTVVDACATAGDSVKLPAAVAGTSVIVFIVNKTANACDVFPNTSDKIDGGAADAAYSLAPGASQVFRSVDAENWYSWTTTVSKLTAVDGIVTKTASTDTANPPTQAELVTAFGAAATTGSGFIGVLDDAGGGANEYLVFSDGTNYWYVAATVGA